MTLTELSKSVAITALGLAVLSGCESSGLSPRETRNQNFSTYLYSLYDDGGARQSSAARRGESAEPLRTPLRVGVAQVGEVAPGATVVARLRRQAGLFVSVQPVPGMFGDPRSYGPPDAAEARRRVDMMRQHARDLGMDYLLLYGGTMDYASQQTPTALLDLTIVGAYVVPSKDVKAVGRASAALIDARTGRVVLSASSEGARKKWVPTMTQDGAELDVLQGLRDEVVGRMADEVVARVRERVAAG